MKKIKIILLFLFMGGCFLYTNAQSLEFVSWELTYSPDSVEIGQPIRIKFIYQDSSSTKKFSEGRFIAGVFEGFEVLGKPYSSNSISSMTKDGRTLKIKKRTFEVRLLPTEKGTLYIPSCGYEINGTTLQSKKTAIVVNDKIPQEHPSVFLKADLSTDTAYLGQQVILNYTLYCRKDIHLYNQIDIEIDTFHFFKSKEIGRIKKDTVDVNGESYFVYNFKAICLFPQFTGDFEIIPYSLIIEYQDSTILKKRSYLRSREKKSTYCTSEPVQLFVKEFPEPPPSFQGAVNCSKIESNLVHDLAVYKIAVDVWSEGDADRIYLPTLLYQDGSTVSVLDSIQDLSNRFETLENKINFSYHFDFRKKWSKDTLYPQITYFDTEDHAYKTLVDTLIIPVISNTRDSLRTKNKKIETIAKDTTIQSTDLLFLIDGSSSMLTQDLQPDRISYIRNLLANQLSFSDSVNIGIILFGEQNRMLGSFTNQKEEGVKAINAIRTIKPDGTIPDIALLAALDLLKKRPSSAKGIVLLSDGKINSNQYSPFSIASLANTYGIKIFSLGIVAEPGIKYNMPVARRTDWKYIYGEAEPQDDPEFLQKLSSLSNGKFYELSESFDFNKAYQEIIRLASIEGSTLSNPFSKVIEEQSEVSLKLWSKVIEIQTLSKLIREDVSSYERQIHEDSLVYEVVQEIKEDASLYEQQTYQDSLPYEVIREYTGNNDYHVKFLYLKTENKIPQSHLESLIKKYNQDHPNKYSSKGFFLYHNEEYYATALNFESRRFGWNQKDTMVVEEYVTDKKSFIAKRDSIINAKRAELEMHPKDSILCYCDYFFNPFVANKIIYKKWDTGTFRLPNMNGIKVELNKKDFYKQFLKYGDTNQDVFSLHFSKPYKDTPYHSLHYINDFGDMVIKQDRDSGILSVCRKWNH